MKKVLMTFVLIAAMGSSLVAFADHHEKKAVKADAKTPSAAEQVKGLEQMCEEKAAIRLPRASGSTGPSTWCS